MRIALISFEFPPSRFVGGIGTYTWHAAAVLRAAGHDVEVFAAGEASPSDNRVNRVWRVNVVHRHEFRMAVADHVRQRHQTSPFDVVESPEFGAEGALVHSAIPEVARVVRLHTPSFMITELNRVPLPLSRSFRFMLGGLRRGRFTWPRPPVVSEAEDALERQSAANADIVAAPCHAIREVVVLRWKLNANRCLLSPNLFRADSALLAVPPAENRKEVLYLGRLEARKGLLELLEAVPAIVRAHPDVHVTFAGAPVPMPGSNEDSASYVRRKMTRAGVSFRILGETNFTGVVAALRSSSVVVLPSRWENFPNVCLEAMAAGRGVVGSSAGGMTDMIEHGVTGTLIPPRDHRAIAEAITHLLHHPNTLREMGIAGRVRLTTVFSPERLLAAQMATYTHAREHAKARRAAATFPSPKPTWS